MVLDHLGKHEDALRTSEEALALEGPSSHAMRLINRAGYLDSLGRPEEALESLKEGERIAMANGDQNASHLHPCSLPFGMRNTGAQWNGQPQRIGLEEALAMFREHWR